MPRWAKYVLGVPLGVVIFSYFAAATTLYAFQRDMIFVPPPAVIGAPPTGSIYQPLALKAPTGGHLMVWTAPATSADLPTFVFFHGNASNITDFAAFGEVLHRKGWGIVLAAYRGYSGNTGNPSEAGIMDDARAILAAVESKGPIVVWGHSLGSGVAARMASEGRARALVLESAFTSITDVAEHSFPYFPVGFLATDTFDTASLVPDIKVPVLILHSTDDAVVPFFMAQTLAQRLGDRATFVPLEHLGHRPHQRDLSDIVVNWLQRIGLGS